MENLGQVEVVEVLHHSDRTFLLHLGGKIEVFSRKELKTRDNLSMAYMPVSEEFAWRFTKARKRFIN